LLCRPVRQVKLSQQITPHEKPAYIWKMIVAALLVGGLA